jgi:hypothetical protein
MAEGPINMHKRLAMGQPGAETHLKKGGKVAKYAKGGAVSNAKAMTLINDSSQKQPLPKPTGKIATMKKGGKAKKYAEGGSLKPVDAEENPGLAKLPMHVRNKMGYAKSGGMAKKPALLIAIAMPKKASARGR